MQPLSWPILTAKRFSGIAADFHLSDKKAQGTILVVRKACKHGSECIKQVSNTYILAAAFTPRYDNDRLMISWTNVCYKFDQDTVYDVYPLFWWVNKNCLFWDTRFGYLPLLQMLRAQIPVHFSPRASFLPLYQILNNLTRKIQDVSLLATCGSSQKYKILKTARG